VQETVFVVKVSKFCNLRCHYCYEHRELHVRDVMSEKTLVASTGPTLPVVVRF